VRRADRGASAVEYGLMLAAVAAVLIGVVFAMGGVVGDMFGSASSCYETQTGC
jgi:pilus assembly protein Flp/PilA